MENKMYSMSKITDKGENSFAHENMYFLNNILWDGQAKQMIWINENYFMIMTVPNVKTQWLVIRLDGSIVFTVSTLEMEVLKAATWEAFNNFYAVAFLDIKSGCVYKTDLESLFHLCGSGAQIFKQDHFGMKPNKNKRDKVYGLPAPATYLYNLKKFQKMTADHKHAEVIKQSLKYSLILESEDDSEIRQENLL